MMKAPKPGLLFFLAVTLLYTSLSPGTILNMGYTAENVDSCNQIISNLGDWLSLQPAATQVIWPRHGLFELIFEIPFLLLSRLLFGPSREWADHILSFQPAIVTSLLCTLIFLWVQRITSSWVWGYVLAIAAGFSTMLWPYAYIGLETTQSLFLLLSGYLALELSHKRTWLNALLFALSCGMAVGVKSNGVFLLPAIGFLVFIYLRDEFSDKSTATKRHWAKAVAVVLIICALYATNAYTRTLSPAWVIDALTSFKVFYVDSPVTLILNMLSLFGSINKGLLIYSPVIIICLLALYKAYSVSPRVVIFACLALAGLVGGCSLVYFWSDETWGPRYLHSSIAPLVICLALARRSVRFQFLKELPLIALAITGAAISFLGVFFYYGALHGAATQSSQSTIEALQYDPNWNHIRFNLKLLQIWAAGPQAPGASAQLWPPAPHWWWNQPANAAPLKPINLRDYAAPQPLLVRGWGAPKPPSYRVLWYIYLNCLWIGPGLLVWVGYIVARRDATLRQAQPEIDRELVAASGGEE